MNLKDYILRCEENFNKRSYRYFMINIVKLKNNNFTRDSMAPHMDYLVYRAPTYVRIRRK